MNQKIEQSTEHEKILPNSFICCTNNDHKKYITKYAV